ncbi:protein eyes shut-like [Tigriopus californicus]|uniref:protein eyes shut-like n=1 Tax=Tigriopus californicus TaxID=6832 RepID=UPI0027DA7D0A|nr:protein eyes shut-like [Tigriopus californicus]
MVPLKTLIDLLMCLSLAHGETTDPPENPCKKNPCEHGICVVNGTGPRPYHCYCEDGYTGINCATDWNECWNSPCQNGATCLDLVASFNCTCPSGFSGSLCEIDIDECLSEPCLNNGTCHDNVDGFTCQCQLGFRGLNCEIDVSVCNASSPWSNNTEDKKCQNGGLCVDGWGTDFSCECVSGWSGSHCEEDIDECTTTSPCLNGGMCMNMPGFYICSCPFGFAGTNCEVELEKCDSNPCENDALCFLVDDSFQCYCVPDFHGPRCQYKYDDCALPPFPKCINGGECLDGVDDFGCSCPEEFKGKTCQCTLDDDSDECSSFDLSVFLGTDPSHLNDGDDTTTTTFSTRTTIDTTTQSSLNLDLDYEYIEDQTSTDTSSTAETTTNRPVEEDGDDNAIGSIQVDRLDQTVPELDPSLQPISSLEPHMEMDIDSDFSVTPILPDFPTSTIVYNATNVPPATSVFIYEPSSSEISTKSFLAGDDFIIATSPGYEKEERGLDVGTIVIQPTVTSTIPVTVISQVSLDVVSTPMPTPTSSVTIPVTFEQTSTTSGAVEELDITTPDSSKLEQERVPDQSTENDVQEDSTVTESAQQWTVAIVTKDTTEGTTLAIATENATEGTISAMITEDTTEGTTSAMITEDTTEGTTSALSTTSTSTTTDAKPDLEMDIPQGGDIIASSDDEVEGSGTSIRPDISTDNHVDQGGSLSVDNLAGIQCESLVCKNGGVCLSTLQGAHCHCALRYRGAQCEEELHVDTPGFLGHSLLVHELDKNISLSEAPFSLRLSFQSSSPVGVIFYTTEQGGQVKVVAYIHEGILHLRVNCGPQHILFSEPTQRVDTGYVQNLDLTLSILDDNCVTEIKLNDTHTMRGEQELGSPTPNQPNIIYFGQMSKTHGVEEDVYFHGFQGCMKQLRINGLAIEFYQEASSGRDIVECQSAVCALKPCKNGAICTQHDSSGSWFCNCPPGFAGPLCERLVCDTNPCQSGGTCLGSKVGPGFICLCPAGTIGALCEKSFNITQPSFTTSVGGYSSYLAYGINSQDVSLSFEAQFHFVAPNSDQIALLFFLGQHGINGYGTDYMAVSYVKGHILLTWDLGSGPRRIFTSQPIDYRYVMHSVRFGRYGKRGWLQVDQFPNITGKAPGTNEFLNGTSKVFLGGHEIHNFTFLPHDLPVHRGFEGCIFDFSLKSSYSVLPLIPLHSMVNLKKVHGRNIQECHQDICSTQPCQRGGTCIGYGASFTCSCPDGWFGVRCQEETSLCTTGKHKCSQDSECSLHLNGTYFCKCPFGKSGNYCTESLDVSDARLGSPYSQLWINLTTNLRQMSLFSMEIKPESSEGMLLFLGQSRDFFNADFFSLSLQNGSLVLAMSLGGSRSTFGNVLTLSLCCINTNEWNQIEAGRTGRDAFLKLNGQNAVGRFHLDLISLDVVPILYLGNIKEDYRHPLGELDFQLSTYQGCLRNIQVNTHWHPLRPSFGWNGWDVYDCDGTACGKERCQRRGTCDLNENKSGGFECQCEEPFHGRECEVHELCEGSDGCRNGASCEVIDHEIKCNCPFGFEGQKCQNDISVDVPKLLGDGYLSYDTGSSEAFKDETSLSLDIHTNVSDGLILWIGQDVSNDDYLGFGLKEGMLHLVWNLGWLSRSELTIPSPLLNDGNWHSISVSRTNQNLELRLDGTLFGSRVTGSFSELNVDPVVYLGGSSFDLPTLDLTRGQFDERFQGCLRDVIIQGEKANLQSDNKVSGGNVHECSSTSGTSSS